jgi:hypothetical protein
MIKNLIVASTIAATAMLGNVATTTPAEAHGWRGPFILVRVGHPMHHVWNHCGWYRVWHHHHRVWVKNCRWY